MDSTMELDESHFSHLFVFFKVLMIYRQCHCTPYSHGNGRNTQDESSPLRTEFPIVQFNPNVAWLEPENTHYIPFYNRRTDFIRSA
jgi:hypothetical protein